MEFMQIRSAASIAVYGGLKFLIDPWFAPKDSYPPIPGAPHPGLRFALHELLWPVEQIVQVDAVIVTHLHFDHFDASSVKALPKDLPLFCQDKYDLKVLQQLGFTKLKALTHSGLEFKGVRLTKVGAHHGEPARCEEMYEKMQMRGQACGVVFSKAGEPVFYLAGDTIYCDYVEAAIRRYAPQVIAVNACGASIEGYGHIIFDLNDLRALHAFAPKLQVIATHMDNVGHASVWRSDLRDLKQELDWPQLSIPEDGETLTFRAG